MRYLIVGVVVLLSLSVGVVPGEARAADADTIARVDAFIDSEMRDAGIPGVALAIVEGDRTVHLRGFGVADNSGRPVTPQTPFPIASMSKTFTSLAVMQLVEAGKLALDAPVRTYIPWFDDAHGPAAAAITVRHLLAQRSGILGDGDAEAFNDSDRSAAALENRVRRIATRQALVSTPGAAFHYCNANFDVLGYLIEVASGASYEAYVQRHIFDPLEMSRTYASLDEARHGGLAAGFYRWWGVPLETDMLPAGRRSVPSAGLASSVEDLSHWLIAHLNAGRYREQSVLSSEDVALVHRQVGGFDYEQYALGWFVSPAWDAGTLSPDGARFDVPTFVAHGGIHPAYHGSLELFPDRGLAFAILMNTYDATAPSRYERLDWGVRAILLGKEPGPIVLDDPLLRHIKVITLGLVAIEAAAAAWSIRGWRAGARLMPSAMIASAVFVLSLAFAFGYLPGQITSYLIGVAINRFSDIAVTAVALITLPIVWAIALALIVRGRRLQHTAG